MDTGELVFPSRKKKKRAAREVDAGDGGANDTVPGEDDYPYIWLLGRALSRCPPPAEGRAKAKFGVPTLARDGGSRTVWTNFAAFCAQCQRHPDHVGRFVGCEMGSACAPTPEGRLRIKARVSNGKMEGICRKYVNDYVICVNCKSLDTMLDRDASTRLTFMDCHACQARRSVAAVREGYVSRRPRARAPDEA